MSSQTSGKRTESPPEPLNPIGDWPRLTFDLDVDVCVIGAGLAGLTVAREAARRGAEVAVLEAQTPAWNASSRNFGTVIPAHAADARELIERVGFDHARELWSLAQAGADRVKEIIAESAMPGVTPVPGLLQVSLEDAGEALIERLQTLNDFGAEVEGWQVEQVRGVLQSGHFFHALHWPGAFSIDGARYAAGLAAEVERIGVRVFAHTPAVQIDPTGIRKRVATPSARLRASHIVLAGNVHLGKLMPRLAQTLVPVWRHVAVTAPVGERLRSAIAYDGAVISDNGMERFRVLDGGRLMWSCRLTTWDVGAAHLAGAVQRRIQKVFPQLGKVAIDRTWSGVFGRTVHGMPQIGELRPGLWVASGFGDQGLAMTALAGQLVAQGITERDDRWRLFEPFELVWAGGVGGRIVGQVAAEASRARTAVRAQLARLRERARIRERERERRIAAANAMERTHPQPPASRSGEAAGGGGE